MGRATSALIIMQQKTDRISTQIYVPLVIGYRVVTCWVSRLEDGFECSSRFSCAAGAKVGGIRACIWGGFRKFLDSERRVGWIGDSKRDRWHWDSVGLWGHQRRQVGSFLGFGYCISWNFGVVISYGFVVGCLVATGQDGRTTFFLALDPGGSGNVFFFWFMAWKCSFGRGRKNRHRRSLGCLCFMRVT